MELDSNWIGKGIHYLENISIAAVIGFKKVFKNNMENFKILSDKRLAARLFRRCNLNKN